MPPPNIPYYDHEVVAAFNSCLDLKKYKALPQKIKTRFCELLKAHRIKPVCFMEAVGLGLKVFNDGVGGQLKFGMRGGDEVDLSQTTGTLNLDTDGSWMRCPATLYLDKNLDVNEFLIMDEKGLKWVEDECEEDNDMDEEVPIFQPDWVTTRSRAKTYRDKMAAENIAKAIKGVVVRK